MRTKIDRRKILSIADLLRAVRSGRTEATGGPPFPSASSPPPGGSAESEALAQLAPTQSIGIDIQAVKDIPDVPDVREDGFYQATFSNREIGYCLLTRDPRASFAGRFAAKEAIIKADPARAALPLNKIEISVDENGAPLTEGCSVSISHSGEFAVAVALKVVT